MRHKHGLGMEKDDLSGEISRRPVLQAPRRAGSKLLTHHQRQVKYRVVNEESFEDVLTPSKMHAPQGSGFQPVSEGPFQHHAPLLEQFLSASPSDSTAIGIDGLLLVRRVLSAAPAPIRLRDIAPDLHLAKIDYRFVAVISLVGADFGKPIFSNLRFGFWVVGQLLYVLGGLDQRFFDRRRVTRGRAMEILDAALALDDGVSPFVFTIGDGQPLFEKQMRRLLQKHKIAAVPHGFRSSFRDWAAEETNHPREVIEAALAHVVRNKVEAAYARSDLFERRCSLMDDWAAYLAQGTAKDSEPSQN